MKSKMIKRIIPSTGRVFLPHNKSPHNLMLAGHWNTQTHTHNMNMNSRSSVDFGHQESCVLTLMDWFLSQIATEEDLLWKESIWIWSEWPGLNHSGRMSQRSLLHVCTTCLSTYFLLYETSADHYPFEKEVHFYKYT